MGEERRICWPDFDATCLEGGCLYCNDHPFRPVGDIEEKALAMRRTHNRGDGKTARALEAFEYGQRNHWHNIEARVR